MDIPKRLGRYIIEKELGKGAMGRVFLAHDPAIERKLAIKTIHVPHGTSAAERSQVLERFQREVKAAGRLAHPHIITIYDAGQDPIYGMFIAMEYVEGRELEEYTQPGGLLPPRTVATIGCQAADALAYAHAKGIVHRDIKPANLILVGEKTIKIADFGLAKPEGTTMTHDGTLLGTPYYMSPEQIQGGNVDGRSDLFSLAVVVYELLTGRRPFRGSSISTVLYRILQEPPVEPDLSRLAGAPAVKAFLARALAKKPEARFQSGDEFARGLREAFATTPENPASTVKPARPAPSARPRGPGAQPPAATRGNPASRRGTAARTGRRPARKRRRSRSLTPLLALLVAGVAVAFVYRDAIFDWAAPYFGIQQQVPAAAEEGAEEGAEGTVPGDAPAGDTSGSEPPTEPSESSDQAAPAPAPPPPPVQSLITLRSEPPGATFQVDGRTLPAPRIPAPESGQTVTVNAVLGCQDATRRLGVAEAGTEVVFHLEAANVTTEIVSEPAGASVVVDGSDKGRTPVNLSLDACSSHTLELRRNGFKDWRRELELAEGRLQVPETIQAELVPLPRGTLVAPTPPYSVEMKLDSGRRLKAGEKASLVAATYRLTVSSETLLLRRQVRVTVRPDRSVSPDITFPPIARLTVRAQPSNARIEVSSDAGKRDLGAPPILGEELAAGTYNVKCTFAHNGEMQEKTVDLLEGENPAVVFVAGRP